MSSRVAPAIVLILSLACASQSHNSPAAGGTTPAARAGTPVANRQPGPFKPAPKPLPPGSVAPVPTYSPPAPVDDFAEWTGNWKIAYFTLPKPTSATPAAAERHVGQPLYLGATRISLAGVTDCMANRIERSEQPAIEYVFKHHGIEAKLLDITEPSITVFTTDCPGPFAEFIARNGELVVAWDGVLYRLRPEPAPAQP